MPTRDPQTNEFSEYRRLILDSLERIEGRIDKNEQDIQKLSKELNDKLAELKTDVEVIKTRFAIYSAIIGFLAGLIPTAVSFFR